MFKSTTTKIFVSFALLAFIQLGALAFLFGRVVVRETETYIYDALARRSQVSASQWSAELKAGKSLEDLASSHKTVAITQDRQMVGTLEHFNRAEILSLVPKTAGDSVVTSCRNENSEPYLCALAAIPGTSSWMLDLTPQSTSLQIISKVASELAGVGLLLLCLALALTFFLSKLLLGPVRKFAQAARQVAAGQQNEVKLPTERQDEIGEFARAFQKMLSELKEREKKIAHSARLASVGQMGASIAHEVKNPLTSMLGYAKLLSRQTLTPEAKEAAEVIAKEADRCSQILGQMLRFSRNDQAEKKPFALREVIESTVSLVQAEAKSSQISFKTSVSLDSVMIGHAQHIQQVLLNLLMNAVQASRAAKTKDGKNRDIELRAFERAGFAVIEVEDHAMGISPQIREKIFDPFFTTKEKGEGTGLGLSVALELTHSHGGSLNFKTSEGEGTTFVMELPLPSANRQGLA